MTGDPSGLSKQTLQPSVEARGGPADDDSIAAGLRGFGPMGILAALVILAGNGLFTPLSAVLVLAWAWRSRTPWCEIGYIRPKSWVGSLVIGVAFGASLKLLMKAIVLLTSVWFGLVHYPDQGSLVRNRP